MRESEHGGHSDHGANLDRETSQGPEHFHPHLLPHYGVDVCERCGSNDHIHKSLCRKCHELLLGEATVAGTGQLARPHQADPAPLHSPPWRRRGA